MRREGRSFLARSFGAQRRGRVSPVYKNNAKNKPTDTVYYMNTATTEETWNPMCRCSASL